MTVKPIVLLQFPLSLGELSRYIQRKKGERSHADRCQWVSQPVPRFSTAMAAAQASSDPKAENQMDGYPSGSLLWGPELPMR